MFLVHFIRLLQNKIEWSHASEAIYSLNLNMLSAHFEILVKGIWVFFTAHLY